MLRSLLPFTLLSTIHALSTESPECALLSEIVDELHLAPDGPAYCSSILDLPAVTVTDTLTLVSTEFVTSIVETVPTSVVDVTESVVTGTVEATASAVMEFVTETTVTSNCPGTETITILPRGVYLNATVATTSCTKTKTTSALSKMATPSSLSEYVPVVTVPSTSTSCTITKTPAVLSKVATSSEIEDASVEATPTSVVQAVGYTEEMTSISMLGESSLSVSMATPSTTEEYWSAASSIAEETWSTSSTTTPSEPSSTLPVTTSAIPVACPDAPSGLEHLPCAEIAEACSCIVSAPTSTTTATVSVIETSILMSTVTQDATTVTATLTENILLTETVVPTSTSTIVEVVTTSCPAPVCALPRTMCGNQCLDLTSDPMNCGACGKVCPNGECRNSVCLDRRCSGQTCDTFTGCGVGGACVCASTNDNKGVCAYGQTPCSGLANCGAGGSCAQGFVCVVGTCCARDVCIMVTDQCVNGVVPRQLFGRRPARGSTIGF